MDNSNNDIWKPLRSPAFWVAMILFVVHQVLQFILKINFRLLDNYYDMLAFGVFLPTVYLIEKNYRHKQAFNQRLDYWELAAILLIAIFATEIIFPLLNPYFIRDVGDVLAFFIGILFFQLFINLKK